MFALQKTMSQEKLNSLFSMQHGDHKHHLCDTCMALLLYGTGVKHEYAVMQRAAAVDADGRQLNETRKINMALTLTPHPKDISI